MADRARASAAIRAVPAWAWLAAIVLGSFGLRAWLGRDMVAPFIMVDELIYSELGQSLASSGDLLVRGVPATGYGLLYPLLLAPVYGAFDSLVTAYDAARVVNAAAMSLAAVPAYLIARRSLPTGLSLLGAVLAVALPSLAYTGTIMTENLFYPVFLAAALALVLALERPTLRRQGLLLGLVAVAFLTRAQAVVLVPALLTAPLLLAAYERRGFRAALRPWLPTYGVVAAGAAVLLVLQVARGRSLGDLLGAYSVVGEESYEVGEVARYTLWHLEELTLYLGIAPVATAIILAVLGRRQPRGVQVLLSASIALVFWLTLVVAAFASQFASRVQERNLFVVAPLVLLLMLAWVHRGAPRPPVVAIPAVALSVGLAVAFPYTRFIETAAISDTLALLPVWSAFGSLLFDSIRWTIFAGGLAAAALVLLPPRRLAVVVPLGVLVWFALVSRNVWSGERGFVQASAGALYQGIRSVPRDWIDAAVGEAGASALWTGRTDRFTINQNEFFNRSLGTIYFIGGPTPGGLAETEVTIDERTGVVRRRSDGSPVRDPYVLVDDSIAPDGEPVARDEALGMTLWKIDGELVSTTTVEGLYPNDTWSGPEVTWTRRRCDGGTLAVALSSDPSLFRDREQEVTARVGGKVVATLRLRPTETPTLAVPLTVEDGVCRVHFTVRPTAVPKEVTGGANPDERELGLHFNGFGYDPPGP